MGNLSGLVWKLGARGKRRAEFAGGEGVEGAEAGVEFGGGETAVAIERAKEIGGGALALPGVAFRAARDEVAVRVSTAADAGNDVIETTSARVGAAQAIEAKAALASVDEFAKRAVFEEIQIVQSGGSG